MKYIDPKIQHAAHVNKRRRIYKVIKEEIIAMIHATSYKNAVDIAHADFPKYTIRIQMERKRLKTK